MPRKKAQATSAAVPPILAGTDVEQRPKRNRPNLRYQAAIHELNHRDDNETIRDFHGDNTFAPEPPLPLEAPQSPRKKRAANGTAVPTKATEARMRKLRERKRELRLARNEREAAMGEISILVEDTPLHTPVEPLTRAISPPFPQSPTSPRNITSSIIPFFQMGPGIPGTQHRSTPHHAHSTSLFGSPLKKKKKLGAARDVWYFFRKADKQKHEALTWCRLCGRSSSDGTYAASTSTGVLRRHLTRIHAGEYLEACQQNGWKARGITPEFNGPTSDGSDKITPRFAYSTARFHNALVEWIVGFDESINVVECELFRRLLLLLRDTLHDKDIPHRKTIRRLIGSAFQQHFAALVQDLQASEGKLSLTVDGWDDHSMRAYLGVTVHYLQRMNSTKATNSRGVLQLKSHLIAFLPIPGRHTGQELAKALLRVTDRAKITGRMRCVTTDGAANMAAMLEDYESLLKERDIFFDSFNSHIICFPHTLHTGITALLESLTSPVARASATATFQSPICEPLDAHSQSLAEALERDPFAIARDIVNSIRMSQLRRTEFLNIIEMGNQKKKWTRVIDGVQQPIQLPVVVPIRDSPTRWSSAFLSLKRFLLLKQPLSYYIKNRHEVFADSQLTDREWTVLEHICDILEFPFLLQEIMCKERTPMLACTLAAYESVINMLDKARHSMKYSYMRASLDIGITHLRQNMNTHCLSRLLILSIFIHPSLRLKWFTHRWSEHQVGFAKRVILEELETYQSQAWSPKPHPRNGIKHGRHESASPKKKSKLFEYMWDKDSMSSEGQTLTIEVEFDDYCHAANWPEIEKVDIIHWWDINSDRYPTIYKLAVDLMPAQASSVPSERAFSSAAETDTKRRNRISPILMEELQILKHKVNNTNIDLMDKWRFGESDAEYDTKWQDMAVGWDKDDEALGSETHWGDVSQEHSDSDGESDLGSEWQMENF